MAVRARLAMSISLSVLIIAPAFGEGVVTQLTDGIIVGSNGLSLDDAGTVVIASSNTALGGQNPALAPSLASWDAMTGAASLLVSFPLGISMNYNGVSDDGAWVAFLSRANPTGGNPAGRVQLFLRRSDGSETRQLTSGVPAEQGAVLEYALAGSGNRVVFSATTDPLGTNPSHLAQLFVVDADGTNLRQLTTTTSEAGFDLSISDDGTRVAFSHYGDLTGGNADLSVEIFAIDADGTNLRQLTSGLSGSAFNTSGARLSGNGARIAFKSQENYGGLNPANAPTIWIVDWTGGGLAPLPTLDIGGYPPAITDDGENILYDSADTSAGNADGSYEIWRVRYDGTGKTRLTTTGTDGGCGSPQVSGDGSRVVFSVGGPIGALNADGGQAWIVMDGSGGNMFLLAELAFAGDGGGGIPDMTADGTRLVFLSSDPSGPNPNQGQIFTMQTDGSGRTQVTSFTEGFIDFPRIADDGQKIVFMYNGDPLGLNPNHELMPFAIRADGTQLKQLVPNPTHSGAQIAPAIAGNGSYVVFQSVENLTGANADGSAELFRMTWTGTSPLQITSDNDGAYKQPRISGNGLYVVYSTSTGVWRVSINNTARQQIANSPARFPDVSGTGTRYVWISEEDLLGLNPDGSSEVYFWDSPSGIYRQLTSLPAGSSLERIRISDDGFYVTFFTDAPIFGPNDDTSPRPYRLQVSTGAVERIGALDARMTILGNRGGSVVVPSGDGSKLAFATTSDPVRRNVDGSGELFLADMARTPAIRVSASSPTVVSWDADPHAVRYDVVRGDIATLVLAGANVDLGPVSCLADDLSMVDTSLAPDVGEPTPGQAFFYVLRGTSGILAGPGSYGQGTGGRERVPGSGACPP